jgi:capsule polysaccharide export protein KpsE/RkpR
MTSVTVKITLSEAHAELTGALAEYESVRVVKEEAERKAAAALRKLSDAQKNFDRAVEELRKASSPWSSEWHSQRAPRHPAE